jgi:hypothetical protein
MSVGYDRALNLLTLECSLIICEVSDAICARHYGLPALLSASALGMRRALQPLVALLIVPGATDTRMLYPRPGEQVLTYRAAGDAYAWRAAYSVSFARHYATCAEFASCRGRWYVSLSISWRTCERCSGAYNRNTGTTKRLSLSISCKGRNRTTVRVRWKRSWLVRKGGNLTRLQARIRTQNSPRRLTRTQLHRLAFNADSLI